MFQSSYALMLYEDVDFKHFLTAIYYLYWHISPTRESVNEKCNNFCTIQDNLMKLHRWTQPFKTRVVGKNEYNCTFRFLVICPLNKLIIGT